MIASVTVDLSLLGMCVLSGHQLFFGDALSNDRELEILDFNETEEANDAVLLIPRPLVAWPAGNGYYQRYWLLQFSIFDCERTPL